MTEIPDTSVISIWSDAGVLLGEAPCRLEGADGMFCMRATFSPKQHGSMARWQIADDDGPYVRGRVVDEHDWPTPCSTLTVNSRYARKHDTVNVKVSLYSNERLSFASLKLALRDGLNERLEPVTNLVPKLSSLGVDKTHDRAVLDEAIEEIKKVNVRLAVAEHSARTIERLDEQHAQLIRRIEELSSVLRDCVADLEAELEARYPPAARAWESEAQRYEKDMEIVRRAKELLGQK